MREEQKAAAAMSADVAATVGGGVVTVEEVDARERVVRGRSSVHSLPRPGTSEGRQLRRWIAQVLVAERIVEAEPPGASGVGVPTEQDLLPDAVARMEIGSVAASTLSDARGRAVFARVTGAVRISDDEVRDYHRRNPIRFSSRPVGDGGWHGPPADADLVEVQSEIATHLLAAARRREYRRWLDARCADDVVLAQGYEHPGDPRQPDNTHRH